MLLAFVLALGLADAPLTGIVKDSSGGVIPGATVLIQSDSATAQTVTGTDGRFSIDAAPRSGATLIVRARKEGI